MEPKSIAFPLGYTPMVEAERFELPNLWKELIYSQPRLATSLHFRIGAGYRTWTYNLPLTRRVLFQIELNQQMVERGRLELPTSCL